MSAAFALTDPANPEAALYDITVYQVGWRLGGKGPSRNMDPDYHSRASGQPSYLVRLLRQRVPGDAPGVCELARPAGLIDGKPLRAPDAPLASWEEAFKPHGIGVPDFEVQNQWNPFYSQMPTNAALPGSGDLLPLGEYFRIALELFFTQLRATPVPGGETTGDLDIKFPTGFRRGLGKSSPADWRPPRSRRPRSCSPEGRSLQKLIDAEGALVMRLAGLLMETEWRKSSRIGSRRTSTPIATGSC